MSKNLVIKGKTYRDALVGNLPEYNNKNDIIDLDIIIIEHLNFKKEKQKKKNINQEIKIQKYYDDVKSEKYNLFINTSSTIMKEINMLKRKIIKKQQEEKVTNKFNEALILYYKLKNKINNKINEYDNIFNKNIGYNFNEILYASICTEGLNKTYSDVANILNIKNNTSKSINSLIDKKSILNNNHKIYDDLIELLLKFLNDELNINFKVLAIDGSNLSISKKLVKHDYAYQHKIKLIDKNKIKTIKENYKEQIDKVTDDYNNKINNTTDRIIKKELKEQKNKSKQLLFNERDNKIKQIKLNVSETIRKNNKKTKNGLFCRSLCSTLYDVNNLIPIAVKETNNFANENYHAIELLEQIKLNDNTIIIFDRKYYSKQLLKYLNNRNIIPIFRMDIDNNMVKYLIKNNFNENIFTIENIKFKVVSYKIDNEDYYIGTIKTELTIAEIQQLYWKRWSIEEFYKNLKHKMKGWFYNVKTKNNYIGAIKAQHIAYLFSRIIAIISDKFNINIKPKRKSNPKYERRINFKECMNIAINNVLYDILLNENNNTTNYSLINMLSRINNTRYSDIPNRKYKRLAIINKSRWHMNKRENENLIVS